MEITNWPITTPLTLLQYPEFLKVRLLSQVLTLSAKKPTSVGGWYPNYYSLSIIIDREAGEIMRLVASVCLFASLRLCPSPPV